MAPESQTYSHVPVYRLAATATVLGFPLMLVNAVRRGHPLQPNQFIQLPPEAGFFAPGLRDDERRTARHSAWIDVADGPILITLGDLNDRHFSLMAIDPWGDCVASVSSRCQPTGDPRLTIVGWNWTGALQQRGIAVRAPSNLVWVVSRVSEGAPAPASEPASLPAPPSLNRIVGAGLEPIKPAACSLAPDVPRALDMVAQLSPVEFFHRMAVLNERYPPRPGNTRLELVLRRLEAARAAAGAAGAPALASGLTAGVNMIRRAAARQEYPAPTYWTRAGVTLDISRMEGLRRAAQAWNALGAPRAADLLQFFTNADATGAPLNGGERYELRFPPGEEPPVNAFWELSCDQAQAAVFDPGVSVSSDRSPVRTASGVLRILIQKEPPSPSTRANWLRTTDGIFNLAMRLHWPTGKAVSGEWMMPAVKPLSGVLPQAHRSLAATSERSSYDAGRAVTPPHHRF